MSGGVPAGWVLVPIEPTEAMLDALSRQAQKPTGWHNVYPAMYRAILAATPTPPSRDADVERVAIARIIDPAAWETHDTWQRWLGGDGRLPDEDSAVDRMRQSYLRRLPTVIAPSLEKADAILARAALQARGERP